MPLDEPVDSLPKTSAVTIRRLKSFGIKTHWDLLNHFPTRYEDYSVISPINMLQEGEVTTIIGEIKSATQLRTKRGFKIQKFTLEDQTGKIELTWYNQPYLLTLFKAGKIISASGVVKRFGNKNIFEPKEYELLGKREETLHTGRLIPIYPEKRGLSSRTIREKLWNIMQDIKTQKSEFEFLPKEILASYDLLNESDAYWNIHRPRTKELSRDARKRLSFDEVFIIQLSATYIRQEWNKERMGYKLKPLKDEIDNFIKRLPFKLTGAQQKVIQEILNDLAHDKPMNRFLQGEVGSGKTVVAAVACYLTYLNGYQSLFMAPTEILAEQHYKTVKQLFSAMKKTPQIMIVTGATKPKKASLERADIIIGTHALIQKKLKFNKIGLVVVDEQHRFGVTQRAQLKEKGINPHLLTMTATPIPRTIVLTLYGELDLSVIDEMPKGRMVVKTYFVPKHKRSDGYKWIAEKIKKDKIQVFVVCPLIEESENETMQSVRAATREYEYLKQEVFPKFSVALLHGKMKSSEKNQVMEDFKNKKYDILVATSVVEVGVDIPNATIMLIEGAERFGLAQLHQLRGRVGRGKIQSHCLLYTEHEDRNIIERLKFFANNSDGSRLAQYDLARRGPGEIYGTAQHGYSELKIASFSDFELLEKTKQAVNLFLSKYDLSQLPNLKARLELYRTHLISRD